MPEACNDLRVFNDFERNPELLKNLTRYFQPFQPLQYLRMFNIAPASWTVLSNPRFDPR
jgi:hypothetical protein